MFQEKRPTCVTVIGWVWIIIGGLMCLSAIMVLFMSVVVGQMLRTDPEPDQNVQAIFRFFPLLAVSQIGVGVLGLVSGINFLKLKSWSRKVLEVISWLLLMYVVGFGIFWVFSWVSMTSGDGPTGFDMMGTVIGVVITAIYIVPLGIMLKYLRGDKVKNALIGPAQPAHAAGE